jgi:hypothetical protein
MSQNINKQTNKNETQMGRTSNKMVKYNSLLTFVLELYIHVEPCSVGGTNEIKSTNTMSHTAHQPVHQPAHQTDEQEAA